MMDNPKFNIIHRGLKHGKYFKLPLKIIKNFETSKISLHSIHLYCLLQKYINGKDKSIIYIDDFALGNGMSSTSVLEGIELLNVFKLIKYQKVGANKVIIMFEGYSIDFEIEMPTKNQGNMLFIL
jgi:hypothetical protein